ncbi:hypothetical protein ACFS5L_34315 [Streptomyces phyllanthi]|uniref:hypothetical protein n=1 Tax=Streptomyces phyllanthi TaxID=1803180 RepID=UPI002AD52B43|nr:hypothetical protein [Streptomyces phyllanthi]
MSAAGEKGRERARRAAVEYAAVIAGAGIDTDEAIRIVQAALTNGTAVSPRRGEPPDPDRHRALVPEDLVQRCRYESRLLGQLAEDVRTAEELGARSPGPPVRQRPRRPV